MQNVKEGRREGEEKGTNRPSCRQSASSTPTPTLAAVVARRLLRRRLRGWMCLSRGGRRGLVAYATLTVVLEIKNRTRKGKMEWMPWERRGEEEEGGK